MGQENIKGRPSFMTHSREFERIDSGSNDDEHDGGRIGIDQRNYDARSSSNHSLAFHSTHSQEYDINSDGGVEINSSFVREGSVPFPGKNRSFLRRGGAFLGKYRDPVGRFVESRTVELIVQLMIIINAIMIGLSTFDFISQNEPVSFVFDRIDLAFLIIFTVELSLHLFHLGARSFRNSWVMFDLVLIVSSWALVEKSLKAIRAVRILRLVSKVKMLKMVIASIVTVLPKMATVALLLALIMFIFSIMFTEMFGDMYKNGQTEVDYFSRLDYTLLTLFQLMTLDGWDEIVREIMETYVWCWIPFFIYLILTGIIITNIVIAIICDSVLYMTKEEEQEREAKDLNERIQSMQEQATSLRCLLETKLLPIGDTLFDTVSSRDVIQSNNSQDQLIEMSSKVQTGKYSFSTKKSDKPVGIRQICENIVNSKRFQAFIMFLIVTNSIMMAVGTFDFVKDNPQVQSAFDITDTVYLSIYTFESFLELIVHGIYIYKDGWASFDLSIVIASWVFLLTPFPIQAARSLRIIRVLRILPKLKSLKIIITAVIRVFPKLGGMTAILLLIFYIFAIIFTQMFKDQPIGDYQDYFSRLDNTMFTLFQIMTMSDWASVSRELYKHLVYAPFMISSFLVISGFIFLNLIIALICEAMGSVHEIAIEMDLKEALGRTKAKHSTRITNLDRLKYIEYSQKEVLRLLEMCTIAKDEQESLVILRDPSWPQSCERLEINHAASSEQ